MSRGVTLAGSICRRAVTRVWVTSCTSLSPSRTPVGAATVVRVATPLATVVFRIPAGRLPRLTPFGNVAEACATRTDAVKVLGGGSQLRVPLGLMLVAKVPGVPQT